MDEWKILVSDDDCHKYIIPEHCEERWYDWRKSEAALDGDKPPAWAIPVNGSVARVRFAVWEFR